MKFSSPYIGRYSALYKLDPLLSMLIVTIIIAAVSPSPISQVRTGKAVKRIYYKNRLLSV